MSYYRKRIRYISKPEMDDVLSFCREHAFVYLRDIGEGDRLGSNAYIYDTITYLYVTVNYQGVSGTYVLRKDEQEQVQQISGGDAYTEIARDFKRATGYKIPIIEKEVGSARALLTYRIDTDGKRIPAYGYDMNAAYGWALKQPMPDTRDIVGEYRDVEEGEIGFGIGDQTSPKGFTSGGRTVLQMRLPGEAAEIIFPAIESPFTKFVDRWYDRKINAETPADKQKAKEMVNFAVGYFQRKNPYLRCAVVDYASRRILSLIDEHTIYCNTDCIVSETERPDLTIGTGIGEFKIEHTGLFAHRGFNYQWDFNTPSVRRIPKSWFTEGFDILRDSIPECNNRYKFNSLTIKLEDTNNGKN